MTTNGLKICPTAADSLYVRPWMSLLLVVGAVALTIHHVMGRRHFIGIPLLLVPGLVLGVTEYRHRQDVALFSDVATDIADRQVTMQCQRLTGSLVDVTSELGYVQFTAAGQPGDVGRLERDACNSLRDYVHSDKATPTFEQIIAVNVLSHESHHLAGEMNEARTECSSIQRLAEVASWLGASEDEANSLAERYVTEVYPRMPTAYISQDCVAEGEWDATPGDGVWP
jgi:hypothetical protein